MYILLRLCVFSQQKCSQYWPEKGKTSTWGSFKIETISEEKFADYVIREFLLKNEVSCLKQDEVLINWTYII